MGMFSFCATNGVMIGGIIAGFMISALGWRSIFWVILLSLQKLMKASRGGTDGECHSDVFRFPRDSIS